MKANNNLLIYPKLLLAIFLILTNSCKKDVESIIQIPVVTTGFVTEITTISAKIEGNTNTSGGGYIGDRGLCWSNFLAQPTAYADDNYWEGGGTGSFTGYMVDLTPGITYYVRAYASNSAGYGYGSVVSFSTSGSITGEIMFNPNLTYDEITDMEGNIYKTIQIGSQIWMAENLKTTKYNDGTDIPNVTDHTEWINLETPGYCWYINDAKYKNIFGALYNWYAVNTDKLCPSGWHVPSEDEWTALTNYLGGDSAAAGHLRETDLTHWVYANSGVTNSSGFTALPGGYRYFNDQGYFRELGYGAEFWSSTEYPENSFSSAFARRFYYITWSGILDSGVYPKKSGFSCRCVKD